MLFLWKTPQTKKKFKIDQLDERYPSIRKEMARIKSMPLNEKAKKIYQKILREVKERLARREKIKKIFKEAVK